MTERVKWLISISSTYVTPLLLFSPIGGQIRVMVDYTQVTTGDCNKCVHVVNSSCWTL